MPQSLHRPPPTSASTLVTSPPTVASSSSGQPLPPPKSRPSLVSFQPPRGGPIPPSLKTTHAHLVYGAASPFRRRSLETERILFEGPSSSASGSGRGSRTSHTPSWREGGDGDGEREDEEGGEGEEGEDLSLHRHQRSSSSTGPSLQDSMTPFQPPPPLSTLSSSSSVSTGSSLSTSSSASCASLFSSDLPSSSTASNSGAPSLFTPDDWPSGSSSDIDHLGLGPQQSPCKRPPSLDVVDADTATANGTIVNEISPFGLRRTHSPPFRSLSLASSSSRGGSSSRTVSPTGELEHADTSAFAPSSSSDPSFHATSTSPCDTSISPIAALVEPSPPLSIILPSPGSEEPAIVVHVDTPALPEGLPEAYSSGYFDPPGSDNGSPATSPQMGDGAT